MKKIVVCLITVLFLLVCAASVGESAYRTLQVGDSGADVLALKQRMYALGYYSDNRNMTKKFNKVMQERICQLQKNNGLEETGIATPELQELIYSDQCVYIEPTPVPTPEPTPKPTPISPQNEVSLPECDENGFLADESAEPFVYADKDDGHWIYLSQDLFVEITRYNDTLMPLIWFETKIKVSDCTPLRSLLAVKENKEKGHAFKNPKAILDDYSQVIVAFSDDFFGYRWKYKTAQGIIIRDGEILSEKTHASGNQQWPQLDVFAVLNDGTAKTFESKEHTAQEYLDMGVKDTYAFGPILVQDGKISQDVDDYKYASTRKAPRTAIGYVDQNEYLILTVTGRRTDSKGATIQWLAEQMLSRGVQEALNLDGGNTCSLFFMGDLLNRSELVQDKDIRKVTGLIGVTEAEQ